MIENNKNFVKIVAIDVQFAKIFVACLKRSLINDAFAVNSITQIQPSQDKSMTAMFVQFMNVLYEIQQCGCQSYPIVLIKNRLFIRNLAMRMSVAGGKESESYIVNQSLSHLLSCVYQVNDELNALRATLYLPKMMIEDLETEGFGDEIEALKVNKEEDHYITQSAIAIKDAFFNLYRAPPDQVAGIPGQQLINQRFIIVGLVGGSGW
ncbi:MAG: hypothetical protein EZS28_015820 [Streblomastix strix]|uniref:Uncharacterized protein n=1 Tax=Streblomastix strix TaxID=222440 RepID=A0A5J4W132_9EUKA|nr:MAG: hypothetical protein EZS28_015820 [Streblomastix strix]